MSQPEILTDRDGSLGWIRINRPQRLNAFSKTTRQELLEALQRMENDSDVRCVAITGVGRAFCTGGDVNVMQEFIAANDADGFDALVDQGARIVTMIADMSKPVIAAINGPAAGAGAALALACDLRIASEVATFVFTFLRRGLHPDWGGTYFLPRLVGSARAAEFLLTGEMISAERAEELGLINRVVPTKQLEDVTQTIAGQISSAPFALIAETKRTLRAGLDAPLSDVLQMEVEAQRRAFQSPDFREGVTSFIEKRAPRFARKTNGHG